MRLIYPSLILLNFIISCGNFNSVTTINTNSSIESFTADYKDSSSSNNNRWWFIDSKGCKETFTKEYSSVNITYDIVAEFDSTIRGAVGISMLCEDTNYKWYDTNSYIDSYGRNSLNGSYQTVYRINFPYGKNFTLDVIAELDNPKHNHYISVKNIKVNKIY